MILVRGISIIFLSFFFGCSAEPRGDSTDSLILSEDFISAGDQGIRYILVLDASGSYKFVELGNHLRPPNMSVGIFSVNQELITFTNQEGLLHSGVPVSGSIIRAGSGHIRLLILFEPDNIMHEMITVSENGERIDQKFKDA
jgi:hypothetical protein